MKVKDLPGGTVMGGLVLIIPESVVSEHGLPSSRMIWISQWGGGVWLREIGERQNRVYPVTPIDLIDVLEWEIEYSG